jgi:GNAT superfamily N-acetyltransferase
VLTEATGTPPPATPIRRVGTGDVSEASRTLAVAFHDDPVLRWLLPREELVQRGFAFYLRRIWLRHDACWMTADGLGVACWLPPGAWHLGPLAQLRLMPGMIATIGGGLPRLFSGLGAMEKGHPHRPHWYLPVLGVRPEAQGRGIRSRLLGVVLRRCDQDRVPAYLEATTPGNRALYERHGFDVTEEARLPKDGPPFWRMWREPARDRLGR